MKPSRLFLLFFICLIGGGTTLYLYDQPLTQSLAAHRINTNIESQINILKKDIQRFENHYQQCDEDFQTDFSLSAFRDGTPICWTDNKILPPINLFSDSTSVQLLKIARSNFILLHKTLKNGDIIAGVLVLTRDYPINNDYLNPQWNNKIFPTETFSITDPLSDEGTPIVFEEHVIFRVNFILSGVSAFPIAGRLSVLFFGLVLIFFFTILFQWAYKKQNTILSLSVVLISFSLSRLIFLIFEYPRSVLSIPVFSPQQFASSFLNPSLGDLWLNVATTLAMSIYIFYMYRKAQQKTFRKINKEFNIILCVILSSLIFYAASYPIHILQSITNNSNIALDITNSLQFPLVRVVALSAMVMAWCTSFLMMHVMFRYIIDTTAKHTHRILLVSSLIFSAANYNEHHILIPTLLITWGVLLMVHYLKLTDSVDRLQYRTFSYLFVMLIGFVLNTAISIYILSKEKNRTNQYLFAETFLADRDAFGEYLLSELSEKIKNDAYIQTRLASPFLSKEPIQQKIRQVYFPNYFNKYDINTFLFNSAGNNLSASRPIHFTEIIKTYDNGSNQTDYPELFRVRDIGQNVTQQYIVVMIIKRNHLVAGYIVVELSLKKSIPENVYPELLVDHRFRKSLRPATLSYATYINNKLESTAGDFDYENEFDITLLTTEKIYNRGAESKGYQHLAVEDSDQKTTVISAQMMPLEYILANISFYLVLGIATILLLILWIGMANIIRGNKMYYTARIQLFINLSFFIPLLGISIITLRMLGRSSQEQLNNIYQNRALFLSQQVEQMQADNIASIRFGESRILELSKLSGAELSIYDSFGRLTATTQPLIFENQLVAPIINPIALAKFKQGKKSFILAERIGALLYFVSYTKPKTGNVLLAVPYYQSGFSLEKVQIKAFADILNIFAFIFFILIVFSYIVSGWLTFPLRFITRSLQQTSLSHSNEPLQWKANDEIGMMVQSYNGMLQKLNDNKIELERMQREQAWREIAQQVAHEIKNPLTPMKLSLQKLNRSIEENTLTTDQTKKSVSSMLEQVELLNDIATSFSSFAKLPMASLHKIDLTPLLKKVIEIYNQHDNIIVENIPSNMYATADEKIVHGIFANIILNALQAQQENSKIEIKINADSYQHRWQIKFSDNGRGIETETLDNIFLPHFTTKKTGSGLGLAIVKHGVEQLNGKVWVETKIKEGTTFVIEIPIADY